MRQIDENMPWVTFYLLNELFAISAKNVREMLAMPKVRPVPKTPNYVRGVINLRGKNFPVVDLRKLMGMRSLVDETDELIDLLQHREQDHKNWIEELELSVKEKRKFELTTDPHKCAFGQWYDNFETNNRILQSVLKKFDYPHKKIHSIAIEVEKYLEQNDFDSSFRIIEQTRNIELAEMKKLFAEVCTVLTESNREIALVVEWEDKAMVISVDSVATVEKLEDSNVEKISQTVVTDENEFLFGIGKRGKNEELVQLVDIEKLVNFEDVIKENL